MTASGTALPKGHAGQQVARLSLGSQLDRCKLRDDSFNLHYTPPIEKVIKNNLRTTRLTGLQPSNRTHPVADPQLC